MILFFKKNRRRGFSLVELLLVVAIISILAALVIGNFSNSASSARNVMGRQQLAVWQGALQNWVNSKINRVDPTIKLVATEPDDLRPITLEKLRVYYNNLTRAERFEVLTGKKLDATAGGFGSGYLNDNTVDHAIDAMNREATPSAGKILTDALSAEGQWLELPAWASDGNPEVKIYNPGDRAAPAASSKD